MIEIKKIANAKFQLTWTDSAEQLVLNFNPIIVSYQLKGNYLLIHWQAKPKGIRTWGIYDSQSSNYYSKPYHQDLLIPVSESIRLLQIPETAFNTVPTAVLCVSNITIEKLSSYAEL